MHVTIFDRGYDISRGKGMQCRTFSFCGQHVLSIEVARNHGKLAV